MPKSRSLAWLLVVLVITGCRAPATDPTTALPSGSPPVTAASPPASADPSPTPSPLAETPSPSPEPGPALGGGWIAFIRDHRVFLIRPDGSDERPISPDDVCVADYDAPRWDPAGRRLALSIAEDCSGDEAEFGSSVAILDVDAGTLERLGEPGAPGSPTEMYDWSPDGRRLLVGYRRADYAGDTVRDSCPAGGCQGAMASLDLASGDIRWLGRRRQGVGFGHADWSQDGSRVVYVSETEEGPGTMWLVDADSGAAAPVPLPKLPDGPALPVWSQDGTRIAFWLNVQLHIVDAGGGNLLPIGRQESTGMWKHAVGWSPDGTRIAFGQGAGGASQGHTQLHVVNADGSDVRRLTRDPVSHDFLSWSPDGAWIAINDPEVEDPHQMWVVAADGSGRHELAIGTRPAWQLGPVAACCG